MENEDTYGKKMARNTLITVIKEELSFPNRLYNDISDESDQIWDLLVGSFHLHLFVFCIEYNPIAF